MCYGGPSSSTLAAAGTSTITLALQVDPDEQRVLTQVVGRIDEDPTSSSGTVIGPVFCELWLLRMDKKHDMLLDEGFIQGGPLAHVVGIMGRIAYSSSDVLLLKYWNDSGASVNVSLSTAWDKTELGDNDTGACRTARLSTKHEAVWIGDYTILNDGAASGDQYVTITPNSPMELISMAIKNADTVARVSTITKTFTGAEWIVHQTVAALGAGTKTYLPVYSATEPSMKVDLNQGDSIISKLAAVAVSQDSVHTMRWKIRARAPSVSLTGPAGSTKTTNVSQVIP